MDFTEKIKELIARGASIDGIASSFGLDVSVLPPEWILFFSNSMMLTCSMMTQLESFNTKMEGMNEKLTSAIGSLQDSLREKKFQELVQFQPAAFQRRLFEAQQGHKPQRNSGRKPGAQKGHQGNGLALKCEV